MGQFSRFLDQGLDFDEEHGPDGTLRSVFIHGDIHCAHGILIRVAKLLDVAPLGNGYQIKGADYLYHAWLEASSQTILRFDMAHDWRGLHLGWTPKFGQVAKRESRS